MKAITRQPSQVPVFMEGVPNVHPVLDKDKSEEVQTKVTNMLGWTRSGFPACVPVPLDLQNINFLSVEEYLVAVKADGTRYLMLIDGQEEIYFVNRNNEIFQVDNLLPFLDPVVTADNHHQYLDGTLVDGEMLEVEEEDGDVKKFVYLIFDVITVNGECVMAKTLKERKNIINERIVGPRQKYLDKLRLLEPFQVEAQQYWAAEEAEFVYRNYAKSLKFKEDGLIFTSVNDPYNYYPAEPGRCDKKLKWKPETLNTVDFLLKFGITKKFADLCVSDVDTPFGQIELTEELEKLNGEILEFTYKDGRWKYYRHRWDKLMPNNFHTATTTLRSIQMPVSEEFLYKYMKQNGFKKPPSTPTNHNRTS